MTATEVKSTTTKNEKTIADYLGDLVALEEHIESALDHQLGLTKGDETVGPVVQGFHDMVRDQRDAVKEFQTKRGTTAGNPIIAAASNVLGKAAGLIDKVRTEAISKALRDDYTAFNLAAISYSMFYATAKSLGDKEAAELAKKHLAGYAGAVQQINHVISRVVLNELAKDEHEVDFSTLAKITADIDNAWKSTAS